MCAITLLEGVSRFPGPPDPVITTVRVWDRVFSTEGVAFLVDKSFRPVRFGNHKQKSTDVRAEAAGDGQSGDFFKTLSTEIARLPIAPHL